MTDSKSKKRRFIIEEYNNDMKRVGDQIVLSYTVNSPKKLFNPEGDETQKNRPRKKYATEEFVVKAIDNALENKHYATEEFVVKAIDNALENKHYATEEFVVKAIDNALENKHYATEEFVVKAIDNALENKHYATEEFVKKEIAASEERTKQWINHKFDEFKNEIKEFIYSLFAKFNKQ